MSSTSAILSCYIFLAPAIAFAQEPTLTQASFREAANLLTMSEALLAETSLTSAQFSEPIQEFVWEAQFSDRQWSLIMYGIVNDQESNVTINGYLWGEDAETIAVSYSGTGQIGGEPVLLHGQAVWLYDEEAQDYQAMNFEHVLRFGENSFWGWVLGAEIVVGGVAGAGAAVGGTSLATGGLALGAAPWIGAGGAMAGARTMVTISAGAQQLLEEEEAPAPPETPERPSLENLQEEGDTIGSEPGRIIVVMDSTGSLSGTAVDGVHVLSGFYSLTEGRASGNLYATQ